MTPKKEKKGFAIASLVLAIIGLIFMITILGIPLGVIAVILGLIFGIIAFKKKQTKSLAVVGVIISSILILTVTSVTIVLVKFVQNNRDILVEPIKEFSAMINENPDLLVLIQNNEFAKKFEDTFKSKMLEKFGSGSELNGWNEIKNEVPGIFDEMKNIMLDLKDKYPVGQPKN